MASGTATCEDHSSLYHSLLSFYDMRLNKKDSSLSNSLESLLCMRTSLEGTKFSSFPEKLEDYKGTHTIEFLYPKCNRKLIFKKIFVTFSYIYWDVER